MQSYLNNYTQFQFNLSLNCSSLIKYVFNSFTPLPTINFFSSRIRCLSGFGTFNKTTVRYNSGFADPLFVTLSQRLRYPASSNVSNKQKKLCRLHYRYNLFLRTIQFFSILVLFIIYVHSSKTCTNFIRIHQFNHLNTEFSSLNFYLHILH